ncbi:MAG: biopolymer transporter ExbD [Verrucomicrobiales bacterium]|nr:biopolymer transporter ExbD [Verrucomicrobiales bacterium]
MHIATRRRRTPIIPIIPLMDILVILLIFFMLTTTFPEKRESLAIDLPKVTNLPASTKIDHRITLEIAQNNEMRLADAPVNLRGLAGALKKMKAALPDAKIELKADDDVSLQLLLQVWEILTEQGFPIKDVPVRVQVN